MVSSANFLASRLFSAKGLRAVVTGGGTGIGLMATQALAANGARVYIVGRRKEVLDNVVEKYGPEVEGEIIALPGDISDKEDVKRLAQVIKEKEGLLHVLINNAGIAGPKTPLDKDKPLEQLCEDLLKEDQSAWDDVFRTNVQNIFYTTTAFMPLLQKTAFGADPAGKAIYEKFQPVVINTTSISGLVKSAQNHFAYNSSKAAAVHITRMLGTEFGHTGVRFNSVNPGVFPSEMTGEESDDKNKVDLEDQFDPKSMSIPADRAGSDEDLGGTFLYLASRAGQYTNGAVIPVDGGTLLTNPSAY
ncbi:hypothetical protein JCM8097_008177 [Rhodosporidiobolus ruineniae]